MKGTPETPQCGFSRTSIQILGLQGVDPKKFTAYNVLEDEELRSGAYFTSGGRHLLDEVIDWRDRHKRIFRLAYDTSAICG